ncbi:MAG: mechanosensitive ion channel family protein [Deltaproteobacteria bacterium]|nr:mechanosensitive ion channel family protein [Kofleriaceae bacterium]
MNWLEIRWEQFLVWTEENIPSGVVALAIVLVGYVVAAVLSRLAARLLRRWSARLVGVVDRMGRRRGVPMTLEQAEAETLVVDVTSRIVFWLVFFVFLATATATIGVPVVSSWLAGFAAYLPRVLAAVAIVLLGVLAGHAARILVMSTAVTSGIHHTRTLGATVQVAAILITSVIAVEQLGIEATFLVVLGSIAVGAVLGGTALAFGLGARGAVSDLVACHYLARTYRVGHRIRIESIEGVIVAIEPTAVLVETAEGRVSIPAHLFGEKPSLLLSGEKPA